MAECTIRVNPNGPYRLTGPAKITDPQGNFTYPYDVTRDGQRILALLPDETTRSSLKVLVNWQATVGK